MDRPDPLSITRRHFLSSAAFGLGALGLSELCSPADAAAPATRAHGAGVPGLPHFAPKARRVIYLFQSGAPAAQDLFDYKPLLNEKNGEPMPEHVRGSQRLTAMSANQAVLPLAGSAFKFERHGKCGAWASELLPHTARIVDDLCFIKSMWTEAINHDPAITFFQTGFQIAGRPSMGSWVSYGLGAMTEDLPAFVVLVTPGQGDQPLYARLWGNGFLDSRYQGVQLRSGKDPVLYLTNPEGCSRQSRRAMLNTLNALNRLQYQRQLDPEIESRIAQYEMAYRMQSSVPEVTDFSKEPEHVFTLYGEDARKPGTFAALILDLKQRGMLDDTLVIWGGEFGRTSYCQGKMTKDDYGRDHHPRCFTLWMAGAGVKSGFTYGQTDAYGYNIADASGNPISPIKEEFTPGAVHVYDLQATILHLLGIDHTRLSYLFQGRRFRLTDVHGHVVREVLA